MNILAIDTATDIISAALGDGEKTWYIEADGGLHHSELLPGLIDRLLETAGLPKSAIQGLACMQGPGSFTGLRIAFSTVKGLALALGLPMVSIPTLDCMALPYAFWPGLVIPCIDAKKQRFYAALYQGGKRMSDYLDASPEEIAGLGTGRVPGESLAPLVTGPGAAALAEKLGVKCCLSGGAARGWALCGYARELLVLARQKGFAESEAELMGGPRYIRPSDAEIKLN